MSKNNFEKRYAEAPKKIQDFLISEELTEITKNIVTLANLNIEQTTRLTEIVGNVLLGEMTPIDFAQNVEPYLGVSPAQSRIIVGIVQKQIFDQFEDELKRKKRELREPIAGSNTQLVPTEKISSPQGTKEEQPKITEEKQTIKAETIVDEIKQGEIKQGEEKKQPIEMQTEGIFPKPEPQESPQQTIPEYSFPEPTEIKVEKPISKINELKKVIAPKTTPGQQEEIRNKLLEAMARKDTQPKIVEEMKQVFESRQAGEKLEAQEEEAPKVKSIPPIEASTIVSGRGEKFQEEKIPQKSTAKKPYVLDVKLKEMEQGKKQEEITPEPIRYKKYKGESPFGKA
ncbi:MAG: hypothetical protein PHF45_01130 [Candidatus Pacebacteria bacterium]|nr:hypothetical protein [Candidatus Paceibacterota bacterium]